MSDELQIELIDVDKHYGAFHALKAVNLSIRKGQFVALVGPSGCGKSTLLRSLAGLETITAGTLKIAGEVMNAVPPRKRDVAMVFQSYALYPHMRVIDNLTYSMRLKRAPRSQSEAAAKEVAATTGLEKLLDRYPRELSGGQRQRVAMGRAIIRHPKAFLFDEPLSNLDAALRVHMRKEIRSLHDRLGATSVYVTHDQIEAMTMADHIVVMRDGVIEQQGAPLELYDRPSTRFVGGFIGSPAMNFVEAVVAEDRRTLVIEDLGSVPLPGGIMLGAGETVTAGLRPEHLEISAGDGPGLHAKVDFVEFTGAASFVITRGAPGLTVFNVGRTTLRPDEAVRLTIAAENVHLFDRETGRRLGA
ncbi:ABC transporter ATP-binding protein [Pelagibacterium limicola]|uniref:ABC transporter ATP-binding protein n=1 Tax=Pelagibacterium limicola TaxID=2791022 RepID=UPI0018AFF2E3|nr:sn-glycerol-3-phosphate ABC transporter ATP-binding protein UgpC [Pelagibacterium limicola]